jgi:hypothetical protein
MTKLERMTNFEESTLRSSSYSSATASFDGHFCHEKRFLKPTGYDRYPFRHSSFVRHSGSRDIVEATNTI